MATWNPDQYRKFAGPRQRPAADLLARVAAEAPASVYDLGCGNGASTALLAARWPAARLVGVDSSPDMLAAARAAGIPADWQQADIAAWAPSGPADVIFSNAALHWLDDHAALFPRLLGLLAPGGTLAVQMPRNHAAPSHVRMAEAARGGPWRGALEGLLREDPVSPPDFYYDLLAGRCARLDLWETTYLHVLEGEDAVVEWTRGTALAPLLEALADPEERAAFLDDYRRRVAADYPRRADGRTLFAFRRLFLVAEISPD